MIDTRKDIPLKISNVKMIAEDMIIGDVGCDCSCCDKPTFSTHPLERDNGSNDNGFNSGDFVAPDIVQLRRHMNTGVQPEYKCEITDMISKLSLSGWSSAHERFWYVKEVAMFVFEIYYTQSTRIGTFRIGHDDHKIKSFEWNPEWRNAITERGQKILNQFVGRELRYPVEGNMLEIKNSPVGTHVYNRSTMSVKGKGK